MPFRASFSITWSYCSCVTSENSCKNATAIWICLLCILLLRISLSYPCETNGERSSVDHYTTLVAQHKVSWFGERTLISGLTAALREHGGWPCLSSNFRTSGLVFG